MLRGPFVWQNCILSMGQALTAVNDMMSIIGLSYLHVRIGIIDERKHITKKLAYEMLSMKC